MLKGNIKCSDMGKFIIPYINFELSKKETKQVALHLRNCPKCMEKYTEIQKRKKTMGKKFKIIENRLRREYEISCYLDKEIENKAKKTVEGMIEACIDYKKEFIENKEIGQMLKNAREKTRKEAKPKFAIEIIAKIKHSKKETLAQKIIRLFQPLYHGFLRF